MKVPSSGQSKAAAGSGPILLARAACDVLAIMGVETVVFGLLGGGALDGPTIAEPKRGLCAGSQADESGADDVRVLDEGEFCNADRSRGLWG
mmetsp:Transcript_31301/g.95737  ORF Transcript_31301/g.95737 Transcript_31301/m.95737 type:complete len:92 (-) Transcript_31301:1260-1535(-)